MKPNWTFDRPTEPGEYWLSIAPEKREGGLPAIYPCLVDRLASGLSARRDPGNTWYPLTDERFTGAQWAKRETPADPFAKTEERA